MKPHLKRAVWWVVLLSVGVQAVCIGQQTLSLPNGGSLIGPQDLIQPFAASLQAMGGRFQTPDKGQLTLTGTVTDTAGSRSAQITVQAPGYLAYRESSGRAVTFNGTTFNTKSGQLAASDVAVAESFLASLPDGIFLQVALGGGMRRIGSHFRTDDGKSPTYTGPYWTVFAFSPKQRPGLVQGTPLQEPIFIAIDEATGFISDVRVVTKLSATVEKVTQTQFSNWTQQAGQWFPGKIVRLESGSQTLSFQTQQASVGTVLALSSFQP